MKLFLPCVHFLSDNVIANVIVARSRVMILVVENS